MSKNLNPLFEISTQRIVDAASNVVKKGASKEQVARRMLRMADKRSLYGVPKVLKRTPQGKMMKQHETQILDAMKQATGFSPAH